MKIALISTFDAGNIKTWSGIPHSIITKLKSDHTVDVIEISLKTTLLSIFKRVWFNKILKKQYFLNYDKSIIKKNSRLINAQLEGRYDLIISFQFYLLCYIKGKKVLITDATFDNLADYYFDSKTYSNYCLNHANNLFKQCIQENFITVYSSDWARNNAIEKYNANPEKSFTIPFGANLTHIPTTQEVEKFVAKRLMDEECRLLFLGAFWERKGGIDAVDIVRELNQLGVKCRLIIVGCNPIIKEDEKDFIEIIGFLKKENKEEDIQLHEILATSHALLLPSLAECAACVYAEANAYGLPAIGKNTGGVSTIIKDGLNGLLIEDGEINLNLAIRWKDIFLSKSNYQKICLDARNEYEHRLNYDMFYTNFMKALKSKF